ncbi:ribosomal-protein-alanine N-acetyltransferase [Hathewaya proteolytica DSM 3090]|uniref:Ribosomal-protein-alanine N-acetyltransferase n=1 Tax=Hathewaya proteolytica DSM 3090 TaxID=1121331 RepID=A0A1M6TC17_9CLOT|nr:GNAT family protein [Hathewaya proteolytica]SHK54376.1 ribosomal-protein-alanine N-acetyltransferase [Hathewaya proteolytica DSM 3090]
MPNDKFICMKESGNGEINLSDVNGINIGKAYLLTITKSSILCRLKMYRLWDNAEIVEGIIDTLLKDFIFKRGVNKVSFIVGEDMESSPLIDMGFQLEGILWDNIMLATNEYKSEFIFGVKAHEYNKTGLKNRFNINGNRIALKVLMPEDVEEVLKYCIENRDHLQKFEPSRQEDYYTLETQKRYLIDSYNAYLNGKEVNFGILLNGKIVGRIRILNIFMGVIRTCTVGYSIDKDHEGKGYMKEALSIVAEYAKNVLELHRIEAGTLPDNNRSQSVLKSCGFELLGVNKKYIYINGEWKDHIMYYKILD